MNGELCSADWVRPNPKAPGLNKYHVCERRTRHTGNHLCRCGATLAPQRMEAPPETPPEPS